MRRGRGAQKLIVMALLLVAVATVSAQQRVGRIVMIDGYAEIDAFGNDRFIRAKTNDVLYNRSVIRTEYEAWVTVEIEGDLFEIAPRSTIGIASFLPDGRRSTTTGFFRRLLSGIVGSLAPPQESVADFGGRASEAAEGGSMSGMFVTDIDPDLEFGAGIAALEQGDYRTAADHLKRIEYPEDGTFELVEYYVALSHALLGLADYGSAVRAAFEYNLEEPDPAGVSSLPSRLQLLVTIASYLGGNDPLAREASHAYIADTGLAVADARVIAIRVLLLRETNAKEARDLERSARVAQPRVDWDSLLEG